MRPGVINFIFSASTVFALNDVQKSNNTIARSGLMWKNLSVKTTTGSMLLHPFSGFVANGDVCGILGPSGSGKTTFLSSLGGSIHPSSGLTVNGDVLYVDAKANTSEPIQVKGGKVAWMQQKDNFFTMLTVRETLDLAAFLELPDFLPEQREMRVTSTLDSLGLSKLENRRVGESGKNNALSGGEQRRLSLALELISSPKLFIGDEPTSGLDSNMSERVVQLIKRLVRKRQIPCFLSIHQPRSSIWRMLDSVILLARGGRVVYMGDARSAVDYFSDLGYVCPNETNPAEFLLDLVSIDSDDPAIAAIDERRIDELTNAFIDSDRNILPTGSKNLRRKNARLHRHFRRSPLHYVRRFGLLIQRAWRQNIRNNKVNLFRLGASIGNAYLFSVLFPTVSKGSFFSSKSVADRTAILTFGIINMGMIALMKTLDLFSKEKPVVSREQQRNQYSSFEYIISKAIAEIPLDALFSAAFTSVLKATTGIRISWNDLTGAFAMLTVAGASLGFAIGAATDSVEVAMSAGIPIMVILMCVGVINPSGVDPERPPPMFVKVLKELSPINHAIRAVCVAEYSGMQFGDPNEKRGLFSRGRDLARDLPRMGALALVQNGNQVLNELGLGDETYTGAMKRLIILSAGNLLISWVGLQRQIGSSTIRK